MHCILILRELSDQEKEKVRSLESQRDVVIIAKPQFETFYPTAKSYIKLTEEEKKRINYLVLSEILDFGDAEIEGQSISRHFNISGAALWYYHKFRIYFKIRNLRYEIDEIYQNISEASSALIFTNDKSLNSSHFGIDQLELCSSSVKNKSKFSIWSMFQYGFVVLLRFAKSLLFSTSKCKNMQFLCIDTVEQYRDILSLNAKSTIFENAYLGYMYQKMGDRFGFIDQLLIPKFSGSDRYKFNANHLKNAGNRTRILGEKIMAGGLFSFNMIRKVLHAKKELVAKYQLLGKAFDHDLKRKQILREFIALNSTSLFYLFKFFCYQKFFKKNKFASILTTDENSPNFKIILDAAKQSGVFTVGYQHGSIHELHPAYRYSKADLDQAPMPDLTLTWGNKWNKLLVDKGNYLPEKVRIVGQIRTDIIKHLEQNHAITKESVFEEIGEKKIVLFATQPQRDSLLRLKAAEDVVLACKKLKGNTPHLVFKLHPRENDPEFYMHIADKHQFENFTISREEDLYILLKISNLVITCFSTVGTEALYFNKPLIILDHLKQDLLSYYKDSVAFQATNVEELAFYMNELLAGKLAIDQQVLKEYLHESTYKIDGMTSERVWDSLVTDLNLKKHERQ